MSEKRVIWDYNVVLAENASTSHLYELTNAQTSLLLTALYQMNWSTRWQNAPSEFELVSELVGMLAHALMSPVSVSGDSETIYIYAGNESAQNAIEELEEKIENMSRTWVEQIGGKWYLKSDCSGCQPIMFELTSVSVGSDGTPIPAQDGGATDSAWEALGSVSSGNVSCYASAATSYLLERAADFADYVIDWAALGLDAGNLLDELIDANLLLINLIKNVPSLSEIQGYSKTAVRNALTGASVQSALESAWTFTEAPTRKELEIWLTNSPWFVSGVPVFLILDTWADYSLMSGYKAALASIAAECETGNSIPTVPEGVITIETDGVYIAYNVDDVPNTSLYYQAPDYPVMSSDLSLVGWCFTPAIDGGGASYAMGTSVLHNDVMAWGTSGSSLINWANESVLAYSISHPDVLGFVNSIRGTVDNSTTSGWATDNQTGLLEFTSGFGNAGNNLALSDVWLIFEL